MRKLWAAAIIGIAALIGTSNQVRAAFGGCIGDCDGSGAVTVDELVRSVNIALGEATIDICTAIDGNGDQSVTMDELVRGVSAAIDGCPVTAVTAGIVFSGEDNRLHAYDPGPGFQRETVIPSNADQPATGRDINGQICFTRGPEGQLRFIAGEDTDQGQSHLGAGWGLIELAGSFPNFTYNELKHLQPRYQAGEEAENYGCGFLSDGRLLTSDVGNQASGVGTGQLILWFPPLDGASVKFCKLATTISTAGQIAIDEQDRIYVSSARSTQTGVAGVYRFSGDLPTSDTADGGCGLIDAVGDPLVSEGRVTKEVFIAGDGHVGTPGGLVIIPDGGFYVASVLNGVIAEYDSEGKFKRRILSPPPGGGLPTPTGNPFGLGLASDGTLYFADIGLTLSSGGIGPGQDLGKVRRIRFVDSQPQPPEIMDVNLNFPDGIGILEGTAADLIVAHP
ncbi:MAG: hypothetical protein ABI629_17210 [bacterium]